MSPDALPPSSSLRRAASYVNYIASGNLEATLQPISFTLMQPLTESG